MQIRCLHARRPLVATVLSCQKAVARLKPFQQLLSISYHNSNFRVSEHSQIRVLKLRTTCRHNTQETKRPFSAIQTASSMSETEASTSDRDKASLHGLVILTTLGCAFCRKTKAALNQAGVPYEEVDLSRQLEVLRRVKETTGQTTVPQVHSRMLSIVRVVVCESNLSSPQARSQSWYDSLYKLALVAGVCRWQTGWRRRQDAGIAGLWRAPATYQGCQAACAPL